MDLLAGGVTAAGGKTSLTLLRPCVSWRRRKLAREEDHDGKKKSTSGLMEESFDWPSFETPIDPFELLPGDCFILWVKKKNRSNGMAQNWNFHLFDEGVCV